MVQRILAMLENSLSSGQIQNEMFELMAKLYPICRSISGDGVRETLQILKKFINLQINEVPTGTKIFDWTIPKEWNIKDAYVKDPSGKKIVDFKKSNLHVLNYSTPVKKTVSLEELKKHLFTMPNHPDWIPYRTSYYQENWGFCIPYNQYRDLKQGDYEIVIDSTLANGHLTYGEYLVKGKSDDEVLISSYVCHPSMCNDNLSGIVLTTFLARFIESLDCHYSYRFLFIPETIGSITWLAMNEKNVSKIKHGLVATCVGDSGCPTYKKSREGNTDIDKVVMHVLKHSKKDYKILDFFPLGSDERQFCSPAFNLPIGVLSRSIYARYPEYHTSADDLEFVKKEFLYDSFEKYQSIICILEENKTYVSLNQKCEPNLGKRGLYNMIGGVRNDSDKIDETAMLWVLNLSDGKNSLISIAEKSGFSFKIIKKASDALYENNLLKIA